MNIHYWFILARAFVFEFKFGKDVFSRDCRWCTWHECAKCRRFFIKSKTTIIWQRIPTLRIKRIHLPLRYSIRQKPNDLFILLSILLQNRVTLENLILKLILKSVINGWSVVLYEVFEVNRIAFVHVIFYIKYYN